jgi:hypothetical protein
MICSLEPLFDGSADAVREGFSMLGIAADEQHGDGVDGESRYEILLPKEAAGKDADPAQHFFSDAGSELFVGGGRIVQPDGDERQMVPESVRPIAFDRQNGIEEGTRPSTRRRIGNRRTRGAGSLGMGRKNVKASGADQLIDGSPDFRRCAQAVVERQFVERRAFKTQDEREELAFGKRSFVERARQLGELAAVPGETIAVDRTREQSHKLVEQASRVFAVAAVVDRELCEVGERVFCYAVGGVRQCNRYALAQFVRDAVMFHYSAACLQPESRL